MKKFLFLILLIVFILFINKVLTPYTSSLVNKKEIKSEANIIKPPGTLTELEAPKGRISVLAFPNRIHIYPSATEKEENPYISLTIEEKDYPNLYKNDSFDSYFLKVEKQEQKGLYLIKISNNVYSRGGDYPTYTLLINPLNGDIIETRSFLSLSSGTLLTTELIKYLQTYIPQKQIEGDCWTSSIAASNNEKAWRCRSDEQIYDPCFETTNGQVVCSVEPDNLKSGVLLKLTKELPKNYSNKYNKDWNIPWLLKLKNSLTCYAMTGSAGEVEGESFHYSCDKENAVLLNDFDEEPLPWTAKVIYLSKDYSKILKRMEVPIIKAWE